MFDYIFTCRPSTVCNMNCSYCYRHDDVHTKYKTEKFDIDSMLWHSSQFKNNVFNFCGYGETMMHPQFSDMITELSQVTHVDWVTNGTVFGTKSFDRILTEAKLDNINAIVVSVHFGEIGNYEKYFSELEPHINVIRSAGIPVHLTSIATDKNIDEIIANRNLVINYGIKLKPTFERYTFDSTVVDGTTSYNVMNKLRFNGLELSPDEDPVVQYPYIGKRCPNGYRIFEILHDGVIYDCSFDENRKIIGNINIQTPINQLTTDRICKTECTTCVPMLRGGYLFNLQAPQK